MPTIFGRQLGKTGGPPPTLFAKSSKTASSTTSPGGGKIIGSPGIVQGPTRQAVQAPAGGTKSSGSGVAPGPSPVVNQIASSVSFTDTVSGPADKTYVLQDAGDYTSMTLILKVTPTGNTSTTTDILTAISQLKIYGASGLPITIQPSPDIYTLSQRLSQYGQLPATVDTDAATQETGSYYLPVSLPASQGPYTLEVVTVAPATFTSTTTALSVTYTFVFEVGVANALMHFNSSSLPVQPTASGETDYGPILPNQGVPLTELFFTGLNADTDVNQLQLSVAGNVITQNTSGQQLSALINSKLTTNMPTGDMYFCLALNTGITLGRTTSFLVTWGSSPATSGVRAGFLWYTPA